jgi:hypothetical protein
MAKVNIRLGKFGTDETEITVDGIEITHLVREFNLNINVHQPPSIVIELQVMDDLRLSGESQLYMASGTVDLLKEWGWTPPEPGMGVTDE